MGLLERLTPWHLRQARDETVSGLDRAERATVAVEAAERRADAALLRLTTRQRFGADERLRGRGDEWQQTP